MSVLPKLIEKRRGKMRRKKNGYKFIEGGIYTIYGSTFLFKLTSFNTQSYVGFKHTSQWLFILLAPSPPPW